jgi:hypothetical protein
METSFGASVWRPAKRYGDGGGESRKAALDRETVFTLEAGAGIN